MFWTEIPRSMTITHTFCMASQVQHFVITCSLHHDRRANSQLIAIQLDGGTDREVSPKGRGVQPPATPTDAISIRKRVRHIRPPSRSRFRRRPHSGAPRGGAVRTWVDADLPTRPVHI